jgi:hypothetical protein
MKPAERSRLLVGKLYVAINAFIIILVLLRVFILAALSPPCLRSTVFPSFNP